MPQNGEMSIVGGLRRGLPEEDLKRTATVSESPVLALG